MYSVSGWLILVLLPHYKKGNYSIIKIELFPFRNLTTLENTCLWIYWPENHMNTLIFGGLIYLCIDLILFHPYTGAGRTSVWARVRVLLPRCLLQCGRTQVPLSQGQKWCSNNMYLWIIWNPRLTYWALKYFLLSIMMKRITKCYKQWVSYDIFF